MQITKTTQIGHKKRKKSRRKRRRKNWKPMLKKTLQNYNLILGAATAKWPRSDKEQTEEKQRQREGGQDRLQDRETDRQRNRRTVRQTERQSELDGQRAGQVEMEATQCQAGILDRRDSGTGLDKRRPQRLRGMICLRSSSNKKQKLLLQVTKCATQTNEYSMRSKLADLSDELQRTEEHEGTWRNLRELRMRN